jgi:predicted  nucleic acid-binding Zn-ribbon protein
VKACPTCETELSPERLTQLIGKFSSEKGEAEAKLAKLRDDLKEANTERKHVEKEEKKIGTIEPERVRNLAAELVEATGNVARQKAEVEELEKQAEALKKLDEELERLEGERRGLEEASKEFESAKRRLDKLPSQAEIEGEMEPITVALADVSKLMQEVLERLGYEPKEPQEELKELRKKKGEYDRNVPLAERKAEFESSVAETTSELSGCRGRYSEIVRGIEELGYDEEEHGKTQDQFDTTSRTRNDFEKDIVRMEQAKTGTEEAARKCREELSGLEA